MTLKYACITVTPFAQNCTVLYCDETLEGAIVDQGDTVTVDGNHPLAGEPLNFDVSIEEVRDASAEEVEHGHVHGEDGHEH